MGGLAGAGRAAGGPGNLQLTKVRQMFIMEGRGGVEATFGQCPEERRF